VLRGSTAHVDRLVKKRRRRSTGSYATRPHDR